MGIKKTFGKGTGSSYTLNFGMTEIEIKPEWKNKSFTYVINQLAKTLEENQTVKSSESKS